MIEHTVESARAAVGSRGPALVASALTLVLVAVYTVFRLDALRFAVAWLLVMVALALILHWLDPRFATDEPERVTKRYPAGD